MVTLNIDTQELEELKQQFGKAFRNIPKTIKGGLRWAGEQTVRLLKIEAFPVKYTGALNDSISIVEETKDSITVGADTAVAPHATYVVQGGPPRKEPFGRILAWTEFRLGGDRAVAWSVWHGIATKGTSQYAIQRNWSADGSNPFHERVVDSGEMQRTLDKAAEKIGREIAAEVVNP